MASLAIDHKAYGKLLAKAEPMVIKSDEEHAAAMERISELALKEDRATREELELMKVLAALVENYERKRWPSKREKVSPAEMLAYLLEQSGLKQSDLVDIAPQSNISAMLRGRRPISKGVALRLAKRFRVSPELFL